MAKVQGRIRGFDPCPKAETVTAKVPDPTSLGA
jgi:hypothetical protein